MGRGALIPDVLYRLALSIVALWMPKGSEYEAGGTYGLYPDAAAFYGTWMITID